jgi:FG-GAP-like repeat/FlgD Ig-like domain
MRIFILIVLASIVFGAPSNLAKVQTKTNLTPHPLDQIIWNESHWQDFIDGQVDPSLYVSRRANLEPDSGCVEFFARFDVDNNGFYDLGCADDSGPYLRLYRGTPFGYFADSVLLYPVPAAGNIDLADLNLDGWAELISSGWNTGHATIYWGTPNGPSATNTTELPYSGNSEAVSVYDLDRDTYLDILIGSSNGKIYIYWGSSTGYSQSNRYEINVGYAAGHNIEIGDFDKDGWGDITVALWTYNENPVIYWGPGRHEREIVWLPTLWNNMHGVTVGDFNRDEWLDIVYQGYDDVTTSYIYFGSSSGFDTLHRTTIHPGKCYGGSAAVDWNYDGWLDLVYIRGNWYNGGSWKPGVYINTGAPPYFTDVSSYDLGDLDFNGSGGFVADFNFDGNLDIFINNMLHQDSSYILWGPNFTDKKGLPVNYDHHGVWREPGNIYDRSFSAFYYSSIFDVGPDSVIGTGVISWVAYEPPEAGVEIAVRGGDTPTPDSNWTNFYDAVNGNFLPNQAIGHRYLQYRATLEYFKPCYLPDLEKITITTQPVHSSDVGVTQILQPVGVVDSGTVIIPIARVRNYSTTSVNFPVTFRIGSTYWQTRTKQLAVGQEDTVGFPAWTASPVGTHIVKCTTALFGDINPSNDFKIDSVKVIRPPQFLDVAVTQIVAPSGTVDSGTVIQPRAWVHNYSSVSVNFPVIMRIGTSYSQTRTKQLGAGLSDTVNFPAWSASPVGTSIIKCSTALANDTNRYNDFQMGWVQVIRHPLDVGVTQIIAPTGVVDSGIVILPLARVQNYSDITVNFPVVMRIGTTYSQTRTKQLGAGQSDTVYFPAWLASPLGTYIVKCSTALANDTNRQNDFKIDSVIVLSMFLDVGVTEIYAPTGTVDSGTVIIPSAQVRNYGTVAATFPVTMRIGQNYTETRTKQLGVGQSDTVNFPVWTASPIGAFVVKCSTALNGDINHSNDFRIASVYVQSTYIDVGVTEIYAPTGTVDSGDVIIPYALVQNYSSYSLTFPVVFKIDTSYTQRRNKTLEPGHSDTINFPAWTATQFGTHLVKCSTELVGDQNLSNDCHRDSVRLWERIDAGTITILSPTGSVDSGTVVTPSAIIRNYGTRAKTIPATFRIGPNYIDTRNVYLNAGFVDTLEFSDWTAQVLGTNIVKCSTELLGDENPSNDLAVDSVNVIDYKDAATIQIIEPTGIYDPGTSIVPSARITNYGMRAADIPVIFRIGNTYSELRYKTLVPNQSDTVNFPAWTANPIGTHLVKCSTALVGDRDPSNDAKTDSVIVCYTIDAGVVEILAPTGIVDSGTSLPPKAIVANYGISPQNIPVIFKIGSYYIDTNYVYLSPGDYDTVRFSTWTAINRGEEVVKCSTALAGDLNTANDARLASLMVRVKDVGTERIVWPVGNIGVGPLYPRATVKNYGTNIESFNVIFKIGQIYNDTAFINNLAPDSSVSTNFDIWWGVEGNYTVSCSTSLLGDVYRNNDRKIDSVKIWRRIILVEPDSSLSIYPGDSAEYILYVTNLGHAPDTIDLIGMVRRPNWQIELLDLSGQTVLSDQNGNGIPDVGCVQFEQRQGFMVRITSPVNEYGNVVDSSLIIARSGGDSSAQDNASLLTRILPVYNILVEPDLEGQIGPNQSIEYELLVKNLGNMTDVVDLSMIHTKPNWKFELLDRYGIELSDRNSNGRPDIGPMPALGGESRIRLRVTPDSAAQAGEFDITTLYGESWNDPLIRDSAKIKTTVMGLITRLNVEWDQDDRIYAGETRTYRFWAETEGNINDVVDLRIDQLQPEWVCEFYDENGVQQLTDNDGDGIPDLGIMRPGEQKWFTVKIKAPGKINLIGIPDSFYCQNLTVNGTTSQNVNIKDSAFLRLRTIPNLDVHNFENPFWDRTVFIFSIPADGNVALYVYNRAGERVKTIINNTKYTVGVHQIPWDSKNDNGKKLVPGTYLYLLEYTDKDNRIEKVFKKAVIAKPKS